MNARQFDRTEWLGKLKSQLDTKKVLTVTLRPSGATIKDITRFLGKGYSIKGGGKQNEYLLAVKQN